MSIVNLYFNKYKGGGNGGVPTGGAGAGGGVEVKNKTWVDGISGSR